MKDRLSAPLKEQEHLKELFQLLEQNGMEQEKKQVADMADYISNMETQFSEVLKELKEVQEQLGSIQDQGVRATANRLVNGMQDKVQGAKEQLQTVKQRFLGGVKQAVNNLQEQKIMTFAAILDFSGIGNGLSRLQKKLSMAMETTEQGLYRLTDARKEVTKAGVHIGNIGRALLGRTPKKIQAKAEEHGILFGVQKGIYTVLVRLTKMEQRTGHTLKRLKAYEKMAEGIKEKRSVRGNLQSIRKEEAGTKAELPSGEKTITAFESKDKIKQEITGR